MLGNNNKCSFAECSLYCKCSECEHDDECDDRNVKNCREFICVHDDGGNECPMRAEDANYE
jgi:hypothetical protein